MYQGKSLSELAKEIERQADEKRDFVGSTGDMRINVDRRIVGSTPTAPSLVMNVGQGESFPIENHAHAQIGSRLNIPKKYYDRMRDTAPDLLAENVNHWFHKNQEKRMVRTLDGSVRAFLSDRYRLWITIWWLNLSSRFWQPCQSNFHPVRSPGVACISRLRSPV